MQRVNTSLSNSFKSENRSPPPSMRHPHKTSTWPCGVAFYMKREQRTGGAYLRTVPMALLLRWQTESSIEKTFKKPCLSTSRSMVKPWKVIKSCSRASFASSTTSASSEETEHPHTPLTRKAVPENRRAYVLVNNRSEGNAPLTVQGLAEMLRK